MLCMKDGTEVGLLAKDFFDRLVDTVLHRMAGDCGQRPARRRRGEAVARYGRHAGAAAAADAAGGGCGGGGRGEGR